MNTNPNQFPLTSVKPLPDESNREGIEQMLRHAFDFAVESGFIDPETLQVEEMPVAGFAVPVITMKVQQSQRGTP